MRTALIQGMENATTQVRFGWCANGKFWRMRAGAILPIFGLDDAFRSACQYASDTTGIDGRLNAAELLITKKLRWLQTSIRSIHSCLMSAALAETARPPARRAALFYLYCEVERLVFRRGTSAFAVTHNHRRTCLVYATNSCPKRDVSARSSGSI